MNPTASTPNTVSGSWSQIFLRHCWGGRPWLACPGSCAFDCVAQETCAQTPAQESLTKAVLVEVAAAAGDVAHLGLKMLPRAHWRKAATLGPFQTLAMRAANACCRNPRRAAFQARHGTGPGRCGPGLLSPGERADAGAGLADVLLPASRDSGWRADVLSAVEAAA